jgi:hypothetical protein
MVAWMRAADISSTIFLICGLTAFGSAGVETVPSNAAAAARKVRCILMGLKNSGANTGLSYVARPDFH